eukprot:scaffold1016_cov258-Pinguiococcus_pyrenoidosus.AAC.10
MLRTAPQRQEQEQSDADSGATQEAKEERHEPVNPASLRRHPHHISPTKASSRQCADTAEALLAASAGQRRGARRAREGSAGRRRAIRLHRQQGRGSRRGSGPGSAADRIWSSFRRPFSGLKAKLRAANEVARAGGDVAAMENPTASYEHCLMRVRRFERFVTLSLLKCSCWTVISD